MLSFQPVVKTSSQKSFLYGERGTTPEPRSFLSRSLQTSHLAYRWKSTSVTTTLETECFCELRDQQV